MTMEKTIDNEDKIMREIFGALKNETTFAIFNLVNSKKKIDLIKLDEELNCPKEISVSLNQLINYGILEPIFERKSPIHVYFSLGELGKIIAGILEIDQKKSNRFVELYNSGKLNKEISSLIP